MTDVIAKDITLSELKVGDVAAFERKITEEDLSSFSELSGDRNPLHMDSTYAEGTAFKQRVVFGMLLGAFVSRLIGMELPGRQALILKETLEFKKPIFIGDTITVSGTIASKSESTGLLEVHIAITRGEELTTLGSVHVRVRP